jgi:cobalt-zinc-cadmium efflux system protein
MGHDHGHAHTAAHASAPRLRLVLLLLLALFADAGHLLSDAAGVGLALIAVAFAARPPTPARTFGFQRAEILAAVVNGMVLFAVGIGVVGFSLARLADPQPSDAGVMAAFGALALVGNGLALLLLARGAKSSLNIRGAYLEVLSDALGAVGVLVAAAVIATTGEQRADPVASLLVGLLILPRTVRLLREALDVLLEATPRGLDLADIRAHIEQVPGVVSCHDLHAWMITSGTPVLSAHVVVSDECWEAGHAPRVLDRLSACLTEHFDLDHCTFQLEQVTHADHEGVLHD